MIVVCVGSCLTTTGFTAATHIKRRGVHMLVHTLLHWLSHMLGTAGVHHPGDMPRESGNPEAGQGLVEYALIIILVGMVVVAMLFVLGPAISNMYQNIIAQF